MIRIQDSVSGNYSNLDIEADDYLLANLRSNNIAITINLSFAQIKEERELTINTESKTIKADFVNNIIEVFSLKEDFKSYSFKPDRNELFESEVGYFFKSIDNKKTFVNTIRESADTIRLIEKFY